MHAEMKQLCAIGSFASDQFATGDLVQFGLSSQEELLVLGIAPRPSRLDVIDVELGEARGDF